jgi:cytochrome c-type biogenesis protein CcmE
MLPLWTLTMKKIHIILLVLIAASIAVLMSFLKGASTYDDINSAKSKNGKFVHLYAAIDKSNPIEYDAIKNPNYLSFMARDSTGQSVKVIYHSAKPDNFETSDKLVLDGRYKDSIFDCQSIQTKCPSKYKDDIKVARRNIQQTTQDSSEKSKY